MESMPDEKLYSIAEALIENWSFLWAEEPKTFEKNEPTFPLERAVSFKGKIPALLSVRSVFEIETILTEALTGEKSSPTNEKETDAFDELVNLLAGHLITDYWNEDHGDFEQYLPVNFDPSQWPRSKPKAFCQMLIGQTPLEIRLWET